MYIKHVGHYYAIACTSCKLYNNISCLISHELHLPQQHHHYSRLQCYNSMRCARWENGDFHSHWFALSRLQQLRHGHNRRHLRDQVSIDSVASLTFSNSTHSRQLLSGLRTRCSLKSNWTWKDWILILAVRWW
jgi:hypothetical protein